MHDDRETRAMRQESQIDGGRIRVHLGGLVKSCFLSSRTARTFMMLCTLLGLASACTSVGQVGLMSRPGANPGALLTQETGFKEIGLARGVACRYFLLAVVPWGDSTSTRALEKALDESGGDALINVTVSTSLYSFVPIYNIFSYTCTTVEGTAIRYTQPSAPSDTVARG